MAPSTRPSSSTPRTTPTPTSSDWSFIRTAATTLVRAIIDADREVDPAGDDDDRLGDRGQGQRQDGDRQALDAGDAVGRLDELGEDEQDGRGTRAGRASRRCAAPRPPSAFESGARRRAASTVAGRGAHRSASAGAARRPSLATGRSAAARPLVGRLGRGRLGDDLGGDLLGHAAHRRFRL